MFPDLRLLVLEKPDVTMIVPTDADAQQGKIMMTPERLVDVVKDKHLVLHNFPVELPEPESSEGKFHEKALSAAAHARLVSAGEFERLSTRDHVSRGGQLTPYGDGSGVLTETRIALEQSVRERAYFLWEQAGRPEGQADDF